MWVYIYDTANLHSFSLALCSQIAKSLERLVGCFNPGSHQTLYLDAEVCLFSLFLLPFTLTITNSQPDATTHRITMICFPLESSGCYCDISAIPWIIWKSRAERILMTALIFNIKLSFAPTNKVRQFNDQCHLLFIVQYFYSHLLYELGDSTRTFWGFVPFLKVNYHLLPSWWCLSIKYSSSKLV